MGPPVGRSHCTKSFIWMSGIRIENAMKPTAPPMTTIISGSSRLVSACTWSRPASRRRWRRSRASARAARSSRRPRSCASRSAGICPLRLSGSAMLSPSRIELDRLLDHLLEAARCRARSCTMSIALSSGTPAESSVASVLREARDREHQDELAEDRRLEAEACPTSCGPSACASSGETTRRRADDQQ